MVSVKTLRAFVLVGAAVVTAACGDSSKINPTSPSAVVVSDLNAEAGDAIAESGVTAGKGNPGNGKDRPASVPALPTNPVTGQIQIEGLITVITGTSFTVNGQTVAVPVGTVIRHGSRAVAYSELGIGDRVHVKARMQGAVLEATEVKLQNPGGTGDDDGDDGDGEEDGAGSVFVSILDATASENGTDTAAFRLTRVASTTLPLTSPLVVTFALAGTATNGIDYTSIPLTATFLAGQATVDVTVSPTADALAEGSESVVLTLGTVAPYAVGSPSTGTAAIADAAPVVSVAAVDAVAAEAGPDLGDFRFARTGPVTSSLTVTYTLTGSAVNGTDYQSIPLTVTFPAGQATTDVFVIPLADGTAEPVETVILTVTEGAAYDVGAPATITASVNITG